MATLSVSTGLPAADATTRTRRGRSLADVRLLPMKRIAACDVDGATAPGAATVLPLVHDMARMPLAPATNTARITVCSIGPWHDEVVPNDAHLHLLVNHLPVEGAIFGTLVLAF